jgi:hypothetical protein
MVLPSELSAAGDLEGLARLLLNEQYGQAVTRSSVINPNSEAVIFRC